MLEDILKSYVITSIESFMDEVLSWLMWRLCWHPISNIKIYVAILFISPMVVQIMLTKFWAQVGFVTSPILKHNLFILSFGGDNACFLLARTLVTFNLI